MKKKTYVLSVAVLLAALLALSGVAQSAMWVGGELGGNFVGSSDLKATPNGGVGGTIGSVAINPSVIGGVTIGYDFVNAGFGAYAWPDWMKYFSFAMDLTYNRLVIPNQPVTFAGGNIRLPSSDGYCVALTFLFMAHYGFFPDSEIPTGRVNPYIGVGPGIVWSGFDAAKLFGNTGQMSATNIALVVEPGIRWVCFKNVSIDTAFRYRYCAPSYSVSGVNGGEIDINSLNQFTFLVRANYHF